MGEPMSTEIKQLIEFLNLEPHPEGGFFRETFRAPQRVAGMVGDDVRSASTAIYFLLPHGTFSRFHRIRDAVEIWHHYAGAPVEIHLLREGGAHTVAILGDNVIEGEDPQIIVPAGVLQAAAPRGEGFALCGCTVTPGFDFSDLVMPSRAELQWKYPTLKELIERFTRE
jgi:uncharacterized protein